MNDDDRISVDVEKTGRSWHISVRGVALIVSLVAAIAANCWRMG